MTASRRRWSDLSTAQRTLILVAAAAQLTLLGAALTDLHRRAAQDVNGPRALWAALSFINFIGPISYFAVGRRRHPR